MHSSAGRELSGCRSRRQTNTDCREREQGQGQLQRHLPGGPGGPGGPSMMPVGNSSPLMVVVRPRSPRSPLSPCGGQKKKKKSRMSHTGKIKWKSDTGKKGDTMESRERWIEEGGRGEGGA